MKRLIYIFLAWLCIGMQVQAKAYDDDLKKEIIRTATVRFNEIIHQNELNNIAGLSEKNQYVISIDARTVATTVDKPLLYLLTGTPAISELYVTSDKEQILNARLQDIFKVTGVTPYLLIIHNMPLNLDRKLGNGVKLSDVFATNESNNPALAAKKVQAESQRMGDVIEASVSKQLHKALFICWTRYVVGYNDIIDATVGNYESYYTDVFELDASVRSLINDQISSVKSKDRNTRAEEFVRSISNGLNSYAKVGPGVEFYNTYYGVADDKVLLGQIRDLINELGSNMYQQYLSETGNTIGNGFANEDFQKFYNSLSDYQVSFKKWKDAIGATQDPDTVLLTYLYTRDKPAWYANLSIVDRKKILDIMDSGALSGSGNVFAPLFDAKKGGEDFVLLLIQNTPRDQQLELLQKLAENNNKQLISLVGKIDGSNFAAFINSITTFIKNVYPPEDASIGSLITSRRCIGFDGSFFGPANTKDFDVDGKVTLTVRKNFHFNYDSDPPALSPYEYVLVDFRKDFNIGDFKIIAGQQMRIPAIFCYYLFNETHNKQLVLGGKVALNLTLFIFSAGALNAALATSDGVGVFVAAVDMGIISVNIAVDGCQEYLLEHHPDFLKAWSEINIAYGAGRITYEMMLLGRNVSTKTIAQIEEEVAFTQLMTVQQAQIRSILKRMEEMLEEGTLIEYANGWTKERLMATAKGSRPNPSEYLSADYIANHIKLFEDEGGAFVAVKSWIEKGNYPAFPLRKYVMLRSDMMAAIQEYRNTNNIEVLEKALGYDIGSLKNVQNEMFVFSLDKSKFRFELPDGNELGANSYWTPGGQTSGGAKEAVVIDRENPLSQITHSNSIESLEKQFAYESVKVNAAAAIVEEGSSIPFINGWTKEKIIVMAKRTRPPPSDYLQADYIARHIQAFEEEGGAFIVVKSWIETGKYPEFPLRKYAMLHSDMMKAIGEYRMTKDIEVLEKALGYEIGSLKNLQDELVVFTVDKSQFKFEMPDGNEIGANPLWTPGGETSGGYKEAVMVDKTNPEASIIHNNSIEFLKKKFVSEPVKNF